MKNSIISKVIATSVVLACTGALAAGSARSIEMARNELKTAITERLKDNSAKKDGKSDITIKTNKGEQTISAIEKDLRATKDALDKDLDQRDLDQEARSYVDAMTEAIDVGQSFLNLSNRLGKDSKLALERDAFSKQVTLISELKNMKADEIASHVRVMKATVEAANKSEKLSAEQAYDEALKQETKLDGKKLAQKKEDLKNCE